MVRQLRNINKGGPSWKDLLVMGAFVTGGILFYVNRTSELPSSVGDLLQAQVSRSNSITTNVRGYHQDNQPESGVSVAVADKLRAASEEKRDFYEIALKTGTDKVWGVRRLEECLKDPSKCAIQVPGMVNNKCRTGT